MCEKYIKFKKQKLSIIVKRQSYPDQTMILADQRSN